MAPSDELQAELYQVAIDETQKVGMNQYEISNYALPGHQSEHNLNYWRYNDYIGIGPGAASRISTKDGVKVQMMRVRISQDSIG